MLKDMRFNIRSKIAIGYILIICCLGVSIVFVTDRLAALQDEVETMTSRDIEVHNLITSIQNVALTMETAQRGYLLTGNQSYLEPYKRGQAQWEANYNSLSTYVSDNLSTQSDLEEIKLSILSWLDNVAEPTIMLKMDNNIEAIDEFYKNDIGKQNIGDLKSKFESLRDKEIQDTKVHIIELENRNRLLTITIYLMLLIASAIAFIIVTFVSGSITKKIKEVVKTITEIASSDGDLTARIKINTRDEIKDLGEATNKLLTSLEMQNWIQTNVTEVATMNQGINDLTSLGQSFLTKVAPLVNATYGVFYIRTGKAEQQKLVKVSSYASTDEEIGKESFNMGEGLVGQCALEKRIYLLNGTGDHKAVITSGLVQIEPQSILIIPIEFENKVEAVVEFASTESFTTQHLKLLEEIETDFGITINNVAGRMEVERLLSESQVLTEELQAHTEELQSQSEELQMQQEEMRMTTEHLEEQNLLAEQRTKELEKAKKELEEYSEKLNKTSQYKTNFLANMSHELRTPLNSILILSQMLSENDNHTLNEDEQGYAKVIHSSGNDLLKLIDDILDLSKVEAGKVILTIDEVNLTEIPELNRHIFEPIADKKGINFSIEVASDLPNTWKTDGQRLQQILKNLLSNAFKFTKEGSVTLSMKVEDSSSIDAISMPFHNEKVLAISVIDTGIGIASDKQQLIFEAFQQVDGETNRQYGGTGLGLSICNEFTKLLNGKIKLESVPNVGSTFTLYLPSLSETRVSSITNAQDEVAVTGETQVTVTSLEVHSEADHISISQSSESSLFKGKNVLIVEDDTRNVYALVTALESKGINVTVADNGQQCLDVLDKNTNFDLILMDIMMPLMDGFETMQRIREDLLLQDLPIIALTAKAMKSDRDKCLEAGASDYISKPIQMEQLFSLMTVWLTKQVGL